MSVNVEELRVSLQDRVKAQGRGAQTRLAKRMGIEKDYLSHMLNGRSPMPLDRVQQIMNALDLELELTVRPAQPPAGAEGEA